MGAPTDADSSEAVKSRGKGKSKVKSKVKSKIKGNVKGSGQECPLYRGARWGIPPLRLRSGQALAHRTRKDGAPSFFYLAQVSALTKTAAPVNPQ